MACRRLHVEGTDDLFAIEAILRANGIACSNEPYAPDMAIRIKAAGSYEKLVENVRTFRKESDLQFLGFVFDADRERTGSGLAARYKGVKDALEKEGFSLPDTPPKFGVVIPASGGRPTLGVWVMPDNQTEGALEEFLAALVPPGNALWQWARTEAPKAPDCPERYTRKDVEKAILRTYLAVQRYPGAPPGMAVNLGAFSGAAAETAAFVTWVRQTFGLPAPDVAAEVG
jgi:hypothetical protein